MSQTMFEKYGGFAQVSRIVSAFYGKVTRSSLLSPYFVGYDMPGLIDHQTKFIATLMGGPVSFINERLASAHSKLGINDQAFDEVLRLLKETFDDFDVEESDIGTIVGEIQKRRPYIVTAKTTSV